MRIVPGFTAKAQRTRRKGICAAVNIKLLLTFPYVWFYLVVQAMALVHA